MTDRTPSPGGREGLSQANPSTASRTTASVASSTSTGDADLDPDSSRPGSLAPPRRGWRAWFGRPAGGPRPVEWTPWLGYFTLLWLVDLGYVAWCGHEASTILAAVVKPATPDPALLKPLILRMAGGLLLAGILTFSVPIAMLDESSHRGTRWWLAWLWPVVLVGMVAADAVVGGYAFGPLVVAKALKLH